MWRTVKGKGKWLLKRKAKWSEWVREGGGESEWGSASEILESLSSSSALSRSFSLFSFSFPFSSVAVAVKLCFLTEAPQVSGKDTHTQLHTVGGLRAQQCLIGARIQFKNLLIFFTVLCFCVYVCVGGWTLCLAACVPAKMTLWL